MPDKHPVLFLTDRGQRHQQEALEAAPPELAVTLLRRPPKAEVLRVLPDFEFLVSERAGQATAIDADMIAAGRRLRLIQRLGSLTHDIDLEAARAAGVPVAAWPVQVAIMVAEHMLLQLLTLAKRLNEVTAIANEAGDWGQPSRRTDEDTFAYDWSGRSIIDEAALAAALREGHLAGAALDTFEWEPIRPDNPLLPLARDPAANVLLTPHTAAGSSRDADSEKTRLNDYANLVRVLRGEPPLHRVA